MIFPPESLFSLVRNRFKIQIFLIKKVKQKKINFVRALFGHKHFGSAKKKEGTKWRNYFAVPLLSSILFLTV